MLRTIFIVVICVFGPLVQAQSLDSQIQAYLEANRPDGDGPAYIVARADAELTRDGHPDVAILYHYQIGEARDRSGAQYLVAFISLGKKHEVVKHRLIGLKGLQSWDELTINDRTIILRGMGYTSKDGMCCPSEPVVLKYVIINNRELVARGGKP